MTTITDLDRPVKMLTLLGSMWSTIYVGKDFLVTRTDGKLRIAKQNHADLVAAGDMISRFLIPLYHTEKWYALQLTESELSEAFAIWHFDDEDLPDFDAAPGFTFDQPIITGSIGTTKPANLANTVMITDRMTDATVMLMRDIDYLIVESENAIVFRNNPFDNPDIPTEKIFEDGEVVDRTMVLWMYQAEFDWDLLYNHFGYVIKLDLPTSDDYKTLINIIMDCIVRATSQVDAERLIATTYGIPLVSSYSEQVEDVREDANELLVVTDKAVYGHTRASTALVAEDDEVRLGQSLSDAVTIYELRRGTVRPSTAAITVPVGMVSPAVGGELVWANDEVPVTVTGAAGQERVEWPLGGASTAVAAFWELTHQRRLIYGDSLYDLLVAEYGAVPATINPMHFLIDNVLRNNAFLVVIQRSGISQDAINTEIDSLLRKIMPPHCLVLIVIEMAALSGDVTLGASTNAGFGIGYGMEPLAGSVSGMSGRINMW